MSVKRAAIDRMDGVLDPQPNPVAPLEALKKKWSHPPGSNRRPADYESAALPTELGWPTGAGAEARTRFFFKDITGPGILAHYRFAAKCR